MITFKKVTEADEQLNSQIEELNKKVFPSAETIENQYPTLKQTILYFFLYSTYLFLYTD